MSEQKFQLEKERLQLDKDLNVIRDQNASLANEKETLLDEVLALKDEFSEKSRKLNDSLAEIEIKDDLVERSNAKVKEKLSFLISPFLATT